MTEVMQLVFGRLAGNFSVVRNRDFLVVTFATFGDSEGSRSCGYTDSRRSEIDTLV